MRLLLGNLCMEGGDYERAVQSFEYARVKLGDRKGQPPLIISLVYPLLPGNVLRLIPISDRFRDGTSIIFQL